MLRALGASPGVTIADGMTGVLAAVVVGTGLAIGMSIALSAIAPLGPIRAVYPNPGLAVDWTVVGVGAAVLPLGIASLSGLFALRTRAGRRSSRRIRHARLLPGSVVARRGADLGMPVSGVVGLRLAFEPGRGRTAVPVRSVLVGAVLSVTTFVAALTFASSLRTLGSRPALYGWTWSYGLTSNSLAVPPEVLSLLDRDPAVEGWTGVLTPIVQIDGQNVPVLLSDDHAAVLPPPMSGHGLTATDQIVLGRSTLAMLHKRVGQTVQIGYGTPNTAPDYLPPTVVTVVGTATMPTIGQPNQYGGHPSMGTGGYLSDRIIPAAFRRALLNQDPINNGPAWVLVRLRPSITPAAGRADMQRIADAGARALAADPNSQGNLVAVLGPQRPAEIVAYQQVGNTPLLLAGGLGLTTLLALAATLMSSVHRRRRDLALLKGLGMTRRQVGATVAWQATALGLVGIAVGRALWAVATMLRSE